MSQIDASEAREIARQELHDIAREGDTPQVDLTPVEGVGWIVDWHMTDGDGKRIDPVGGPALAVDLTGRLFRYYGPTAVEEQFRRDAQSAPGSRN